MSGCGKLFVCAGILVALLLVKDVIHVFDSARKASQWSATRSSAKDLATGFALYAEAHDGRLPASKGWETSIADYATVSENVIPKVLGPRGEKCRFAMNAAASGLNLDLVESPSTAVLIFLSGRAEPSAVGGLADLFRDEDGHAYWAATDTSAKEVRKGQSTSRMDWPIARTRKNSLRRVRTEGHPPRAW